MSEAQSKMTVRERVEAVLRGRKPDRLPFIDRLELWHNRQHTNPDQPDEIGRADLNTAHRLTGLGRQKFCMPFELRLKGVDLKVSHNGRTIHTEHQPLYQEFPALNAPAFVPRGEVGDTLMEFSTPRGRVNIQFSLSRSMIELGLDPYLTGHLIKDDRDYAAAEFIIEKSELVPRFERLEEARAEVGDNGFVLGRAHRIPFQQVLLEYLGEVPTFTALYKNLGPLERLLEVLDTQILQMLAAYEGVNCPIVQFPDNLDGVMSNPDLFARYCLPGYQKYADILHGQGKKTCSHTDGNLKPLLNLLPDSGLDIAEAFSPAPLTELDFNAAWQAWYDNGKPSPIIWGGIPSPILEANYPEEDFRRYIDDFLEMVGSGPIIVGIGDQVMPESILDRVKYIAKRVEDHQI